MNLQTVVDTLQEVRALQPPDQRLMGRPCGQGAQSSGGQSGSFVLPPAASVSPQGSQEAFAASPAGTSTVLQKISGLRVGKPGFKSCHCPGFRGNLGLLNPFSGLPT